jgi:hypothetical protein
MDYRDPGTGWRICAALKRDDGYQWLFIPKTVFERIDFWPPIGAEFDLTYEFVPKLITHGVANIVLPRPPVEG